MSAYIIHLFDRNIIPLSQQYPPATEPGRSMTAATLDEAYRIVEEHRSRYERISIYKADDMSTPVEIITTDKAEPE